ncbi:MAG: hypothetical protein R3Y04_05490 [Rikenellaceae bacterium]
MKEIKSDCIRLYWSYDEIVDECVNLAALYLKNRDDEEFDKLLLTKYDELFFETQIEKALFDTYNFLCLFNVAIDDSALFRDDDDMVVIDIIKRVDSDGNMLCDSSVVDDIERVCYNLIVDNTLVVWGENGQLKEVVTRLKERCGEAKEEVRTKLFMLKNAPYTKSYTVIE